MAFLVGLLHVIDDGPDGGVAERLERKDAERLLDLDAKLLDAKEEGGEEARRRDQRPVVPGPAHGLPERQRQQQHERSEEARLCFF